MVDYDARRKSVWDMGNPFILELAKAAMEQSEKRLVDFLEIRRALEAKMTTMFGIYISVTLALYGLSGVLTGRPATAPGGTSWGVFGAGCLFLGGAFILGLALRPSEGALLGGTPDFWLGPDAKADKEESDDKAQTARHYALAALDFDDRLRLQSTDNKSKQDKLNLALWCGFIGAFAFGLSLLVGAGLAR